MSEESNGSGEGGGESPHRTQALKMLNHFISVETDTLCVVSALNRRINGRFIPEIQCRKQMLALFTSAELSKYPHALLLTAILWYRVLSVQDDNTLSQYSFCELLACSYAVATAAVGGYRQADMRRHRYIQHVLKAIDMLDQITEETLRKGCLEIVEKLGFQLFEPTLLHMIDMLIQLGCFSSPEANQMMEFKSDGMPKNNKFYETLCCMFSEPRFLCLAPSLQAAGILRYLRLWNTSCSRYLRRSDEEAFIGAKLIYYCLMSTRYKTLEVDDVKYRLTATGFHDPKNTEFITNEVTLMEGTRREVHGLVDSLFSAVCNVGDCSNPMMAQSNTASLKRSSSFTKNFPYSVVPTTAEFDNLFDQGKKLGQGAYGEVIQVTEKATAVKYAMKFMHLEMDSHSFFRNLMNMIHETAAMRYLHSQHGIMNIVHTFYLPEKGAIAQQVTLYESSLADVIRITHPLAYYKSVVQGALHGLQKIHNFGLVHCDVKPANILIDDNRQSVMADMGLLIFPCSSTRSDNCYTVNYRAPEVSQHGYVSWQSDMWAVGIMILDVFYAIHHKKLASDLFIQSLRDVVNLHDPVMASRLRDKSVPIPWSDISNAFVYEANQSFVSKMLVSLREASESNSDLAPEWAKMNDLVSRHLLIPLTENKSRWTASACLQHSFFQS